jgi:hypothetical protein
MKLSYIIVYLIQNVIYCNAESKMEILHQEYSKNISLFNTLNLHYFTQVLPEVRTGHIMNAWS